MRYPDYVRENRPKGTVVKKVNDAYYVYYATSKRVPEKSYPVQVIQGFAGTIDKEGFHPAHRINIDPDDITVREAGFTNFLLMFEEEYTDRKHGVKKADARNLYRSMIVYLSPNSYLNDDRKSRIYTEQETINKFGIGIPNQITAITKLCEYNLKEFEPLKYICRLICGGKQIKLRLTEEQKEKIKEMGVSEDEIR